MKAQRVFIVGVQKAGTTSLHEWLGLHPDISAAKPKEPGFFYSYKNQGFMKTEFACTPLQELPYSTPEEYDKVFNGYSSRTKYLLDSSTPYFQSEHARENIRSQHPDARILICLRDPIDRAYSSFNWSKKMGWESATSFEEAIARETMRKSEGYWFSYEYTGTSMYADKVKAWMREFPHVKVVFFEEITSNPEKVVKEIYSWLGLVEETPHTHQMQASNPSGLDRSAAARMLRSSLNKPRSRQNSAERLIREALGVNFRQFIKGILIRAIDKKVEKPDPITSEFRRKLNPLFQQDVAELERVLDVNLSHWRKS